MTKKYRQRIIKEVLQISEINSQDMLLKILTDRGFELTQATLSRDIKEMKVIKVPTAKGSYIYRLSEAISSIKQDISPLSSFGYVSLEFSGQLAVMKTRPGYAMAIAGEIDSKAAQCIIGTVAGDDTILLIPRETVSREDVIEVLSAFIPNIE